MNYFELFIWFIVIPIISSIMAVFIVEFLPKLIKIVVVFIKKILTKI